MDECVVYVHNGFMCWFNTYPISMSGVLRERIGLSDLNDYAPKFLDYSINFFNYLSHTTSRHGRGVVSAQQVMAD